MTRLLCILTLMLWVLGSCWPTSVSLQDKGGMPEEWKQFHFQTLENNSPTCPLSYPANLSEALKDGIQNNTRLALSTQLGDAQVRIEGVINSYSVNPIAIQNGDNAAKNRLSVGILFKITTTVPTEEQFTLSVNRFSDFDASSNLAAVENDLLTSINEQIVQDIINKLMSNW